ncbi:MBL fold metallo-hydrolase [uncultured Azohydromonas sp.]|jgi:Zn-dependent hydrolases, including glyoxylases|uniref:MBL fold metallo-hydrolase n=1 Tax=uncultured Azohydromonas sp. TaxID=487342 RepID=UPI002617715D|nr:MBL fold metallo-hydrolase [uncultured Azohydromonas sp.]
MRTNTFLRSALALAAGLTLTLAAQAQQERDFSKVEIKTNRLAADFHTLDGQGGTISVLSGPEGVLIVDSQFAPLSEKIIAAIRAISDKPIRFLVNTHVHGDHTGGNENFGKQGTLIFAREIVRQRLQNPKPGASGNTPRPAAAAALPVITFEQPVNIHLNGEAVELLPVRPAHTDGDLLVRFPKHDILAVGDYFRSEGWPVVDLNNGGKLQGTIDALDTTLKLAGPSTRIVPGHGKVTDRAAVARQRELLIAVRDKVAPLVAAGKTADEVVASKPTADFDAQVPNGAQSAERFVRWLYAELKAGL